ncbi:MAG: NAD-dependent epimerase/dehydratase family protein [Myxococcales bacterium]|nr:NAD-dependent epimerase/dehydratase family protein [Myxococcales bacterium]
MTRVLIVGGAAFLGAHLVETLENDASPIRITVMDRRPYAGPHADIVDSVIGDVTVAEDCARALARGPFDAVVSMVTPNLMRATEHDFERINIAGVGTLLAACREAGVRAFVYISSIAVMDHFCDHVDVDETHALPPLAQYRSPYDRSKRLGEDAVLAADAKGGLRTCSLRMGGILSSMDDVGLSNVRPPVVVIQRSSRPIDMIYGGDAAHAIVLAIRALRERPDEVGGHAFFITKGRSIPSYEFVTWVAQRLGYRVFPLSPFARSLLTYGSRTQHRLKRLLGRPVPGVPLHVFLSLTDYTQTFDNSKAERLLGYAPRHTLEQGLTRIVDAYLARESS